MDAHTQGRLQNITALYPGYLILRRNGVKVHIYVQRLANDRDTFPVGCSGTMQIHLFTKHPLVNAAADQIVGQLFLSE